MPTAKRSQIICWSRFPQTTRRLELLFLCATKGGEPGDKTDSKLAERHTERTSKRDSGEKTQKAVAEIRVPVVAKSRMLSDSEIRISVCTKIIF
jgi:hypothetical protein